MKYRSRILGLRNTIMFLPLLSGCSFFGENIQKNNDRMIRQLCDRWLNERISDKQILKELNLYKLETMDEVKMVCSEYEFLIRE